MSAFDSLDHMLSQEDPWNYYDSRELQHYYKHFQSNIVTRLEKEKADDLKKLEDLTKDFPQLIKEEDIEFLSYRNTIFLKNAKELWQGAQRSSDAIKPILIYYLWQQFYAFFIYTLFKWSKQSSGHGLRCSGKPNDIRITFQPRGFFRRLVNTFAVLGEPSAYGLWLPLNRDEGLKYVENKLKPRIPLNKQVSLVDILNLNEFRDGYHVHDFAREFRIKYKQEYYYPAFDNLLTDFILAFIASFLARYRPQLWNDILIGNNETNARFYLQLKNAYRNFEDPKAGTLLSIHMELRRWV